MKRIFLCSLFSICLCVSFAQNETRINEATQAVPQSVPVNTIKQGKETGSPEKGRSNDFIIEKIIPSTPVKDQSQTGTCWSFSTTSLIESQALKNNLGEFDLSEWFTVRNIYIEKAKNYILRQGHTQFGEGGLGHDDIRAIALYGAMPEDVYNGMGNGVTTHDHSTIVNDLKSYLDTVLKVHPISDSWQGGYIAMIDKIMGTPPQSFMYNNKKYTPLTFAKEVLKFNANDYVNITSFTHHPYYSTFTLEVPDNFSNGAYYNLPLNEMIDLVKTALKNGYSVMWDADVSNPGFKQKEGIALNLRNTGQMFFKNVNVNTTEAPWNDEIRQRLFENLTTEDDHLMHIVGIEKSKDGKTFFNVKNSWGNVGPYGGFINVSEGYFAINTISLVVPRAALSKTLIEKLKL